MDRVDELLAEVLQGQETVSELGRARAYRACVQLAEKKLYRDHDCNAFLMRAAELLQQQPWRVDIIHNRVPEPRAAKLMVYEDDQEGIVLVGNRVGLRYVSKLLGELSKTALLGDFASLDEGQEPLHPDSFGLLLALESDAYFDQQGDENVLQLADAVEDHVRHRIVNWDDVVAVQFLQGVPGTAALTPQRLYRLRNLRPWTSRSRVPRKWYRNDTSRLRTLALTDDDGRPCQVAVDLDDPEVTCYYAWHLEQVSGAVAEEPQP
ncbi:MAG: hypothetical protein IT204_06345 [Fimbriimonadaceae bacterium]|nr:hypothetical protein [Fimbriimonadaceae bacterium]